MSIGYLYYSNYYNKFIGETTNELEKSVELFDDTYVQLFQANIELTLILFKSKTYNYFSIKIQIVQVQFFHSSSVYFFINVGVFLIF